LRSAAKELPGKVTPGAEKVLAPHLGDAPCRLIEHWNLGLTELEPSVIICQRFRAQGNRGRLAQLGERRVRNAEAGGSIPPPSTNDPAAG
jgi:hypothetical protein